MAALWNRAGNYILPCGFYLLSSFFFPRLFSAVGDWMSTILLYTWCGLSANLEWRSEMCSTRLAENTGPKNDATNRHLGTIPQLCRAVSSQLRYVYRQSEKLIKRQYVLHTSQQYGELQPTNGWDLFGSLEHPSKFQRISRLAFVTAATSLTGGQPNFARCLAVSWAGTLYIHFRVLLPPDKFYPVQNSLDVLRSPIFIIVVARWCNG